MKGKSVFILLCLILIGCSGAQGDFGLKNKKSFSGESQYYLKTNVLLRHGSVKLLKGALDCAIVYSNSKLSKVFESKVPLYHYDGSVFSFTHESAEFLLYVYNSGGGSGILKEGILVYSIALDGMKFLHSESNFSYWADKNTWGMNEFYIGTIEFNMSGNGGFSIVREYFSNVNNDFMNGALLYNSERPRKWFIRKEFLKTISL